jgi:hypothetical protein
MPKGEKIRPKQEMDQLPLENFEKVELELLFLSKYSKCFSLSKVGLLWGECLIMGNIGLLWGECLIMGNRGSF